MRLSNHIPRTLPDVTFRDKDSVDLKQGYLKDIVRMSYVCLQPTMHHSDIYQTADVTIPDLNGVYHYNQYDKGPLALNRYIMSWQIVLNEFMSFP